MKEQCSGGEITLGLEKHVLIVFISTNVQHKWLSAVVRVRIRYIICVSFTKAAKIIRSTQVAGKYSYSSLYYLSQVMSESVVIATKVMGGYLSVRKALKSYF